MTSKEALETLFASYYYDGNYEDVIKAKEKMLTDVQQTIFSIDDAQEKIHL